MDSLETYRMKRIWLIIAISDDLPKHEKHPSIG